MAFEPMHRGEGILRASNETAKGEIPEIPRREISEQCQPDVGGRCARRNQQRIFLKIVRWQPVLLRRDKGFKKMPGLTRGPSKEEQLLAC